MNFPLETINIWRSVTKFRFEVLFDALSLILQDNDKIIIGSYDGFLGGGSMINGISIHGYKYPNGYSDSFDLNRCEYPNGGSCVIPFSKENMSLVSNSVMFNSFSENHEEFRIDHFLAYRDGVPQIPLMVCRYLFKGGDLLLSGFYTECELADFAEKLNVKFERIVNPDLNPNLSS